MQEYPRVGFACKVVTGDNEPSNKFKFRSINRQQFRNAGSRSQQRRVIADITFHNLRTLGAVVARLEHLHEVQRMFRISNDLVPLLDLPEAGHVYKDAAFMNDLSNSLRVVGARARSSGVRLSTHPDQFIIPNANKDHVAATGVRYLELWSDVAEMMGYRGMGHDDFCINVHLGPGYHDTALGLRESWLAVKKVMSKRAWALMTVENNDTSWSAADLGVALHGLGVRPVLDVHHNWCVTGRWLQASDPVVGRLVDLWGGLRPKMHFSVPRPTTFGLDYLPGNKLHARGLPPLDIARGPTRPHAEYLWTEGQVAYLKSYTAQFDVMLELKAKSAAQVHAINALGIPA